jgi:hypothetical protein
MKTGVHAISYDPHIERNTTSSRSYVPKKEQALALIVKEAG